jgi:hypothetical protein
MTGMLPRRCAEHGARLRTIRPEQIPAPRCVEIDVGAVKPSKQMLCNPAGYSLSWRLVAIGGELKAAAGTDTKAQRAASIQRRPDEQRRRKKGASFQRQIW